MKGGSMATSSFDEKVIVTNPEVIMQIKQDLDSTTSIMHDDNICTIIEAQKNGRKRAKELFQLNYTETKS